MALKRMYSSSVIESDAFVELSDKAKILWFYLNSATDDDGFCDSVRRAGRLIECEKGKLPDLLQELESGGLIYTFPSGIVVIRHFKAMNDLKSDRYHRTIHEPEMQELSECGKVYYRRMDTDCIQNVSGMEHSIDSLNSLNEGSIDKSTGELIVESTAEISSIETIGAQERGRIKGAPRGKDGENPQFSLEEVFDVAIQNGYTRNDALRFYEQSTNEHWMLRGSPITSLKAAFREYMNPSESVF